jgi:hypothetical protein
VKVAQRQGVGQARLASEGPVLGVARRLHTVTSLEE